jgi:hypothetical protein
MKTAFLLAAATIESSLAFSTLPRSTKGTLLQSTKGGDMMYPAGAGDPFRLVDVDMEHAQDCADHFGKFSVQELKEVKGDLHQHRIQNMVFGLEAPEDTFQTRMMEDEIELQINLLQQEMSPSTLFPEASPMAELPHKDESAQLAKKVKKEEQSFVLEELVEEGVMESLAICAIIGILFFAPHFLY